MSIASRRIRRRFLFAALSLGACRHHAVAPEGIPPAATDRAAAAVEDEADGPETTPRELHSVEGITEYALPNGLRVLLFPDRSRDRVTVNITYLVGSRHEGYGETGMAHLLEHMLFKGTERYPDPWQLLEDRGAAFNGTTWYDRTNYYETMPAAGDNLDWAICFEADRMQRNPIDAEELSREFSVVRNEFEMDEGSASGILGERVLSTAYLWHNYGKSTIGARSDIENVPAPRLRRFYERYYQPDNAVLVIAGNFEAEAALRRVQECFGSIPRPARKLDRSYTVEPVQDGERTVELSRVGDVGVVTALFHAVAGSDPDYVAGEALLHLLTDEPSGRLYRSLVERGLASSVDGSSLPLHDPGWVEVTVEVPAGRSLTRARDALLAGLDGAALEIDETEVARFRNRRLKELSLSMADSTEIAIELSEWAALGDWRMLFVYRDRVEQVTAAQVQAFARRFLLPSNRTVGTFVPTPAPVRAPLTTSPDVATFVSGYRGRGAPREGEVFHATVDDIEARIERVRTPGGIAMALLPKRTRGGTVTLRLRLRAGSLDTLRGRATAAGMIGDLLDRGTRKHTRQQLRDELDRLKVDLWAAGSPSGAWVDVTTVRESVPEVIALVAEMLREPSLDAKALDVRRQEQLARWQEAKNDPETRAYEYVTRALEPFPVGDPRRHLSTEEAIAALGRLRRGDVVEAHQQLWGAGDLQLAAVGDFDAEALRKAVTEHLDGWNATKPYVRLPEPYHEVAGTPVTYLDTPDKELAIVLAGLNVPMRDDDPDYPALALASHVLGGATESRLGDRLREREGWSYAVWSTLYVSPHDPAGTFVMGAQCAPQNADAAHAAMIEELERLLKDGVTAEELANAKASLRADFERRLSSDSVIAEQSLEDLFLGRTFADREAEMKAIERVTAEQLRTVLGKFVKVERLVQVIAMDKERARTQQAAPSEP